MARYTKTQVTQLSSNEQAAINAINKNFEDLEAAIQDTVSRSGNTPTHMTHDLDMNGKHIINIPAPTVDTDLVRRKDVVDDINTVQTLVNTASNASAQALEAAQAVEEVLEDSHLVIVADDLALGDNSKIKKVADDIDDVSTVADNMSAINTVNSNITNINTVATNITNVNSVAGNSTNINAVVGNATNINAVNANKSNIDTVAGIATDVSTVAGISSDVTSVAGNATNINAVNANKTNINAVASNATNINAVNSNKTNIDTVATNISNVNTCATNISDIADKANKNMDNLTNAGKSLIAGLGMPSDTYEDMTNTTYTAPANGYAFFEAASGVNDGYVNIVVNDGEQSARQVHNRNNVGVQAAALFMPVSKGDGVTCGRQSNGTIYKNRFYYAEGEV